MFGYELIIVGCLLNNPASCITQRTPFEADNSLPMHCASFAMSVIPAWTASHPDRRVTWTCRRAGRYVGI